MVTSVHKKQNKEKRNIKHDTENSKIEQDGSQQNYTTTKEGFRYKSHYF